MKYDPLTTADQARIIHQLAQDRRGSQWQGTRCGARVRIARIGSRIEFAVRRNGVWIHGTAGTVAQAIAECNQLIRAGRPVAAPEKPAGTGALFGGAVTQMLLWIAAGLLFALFLWWWLKSQS